MHGMEEKIMNMYSGKKGSMKSKNLLGQNKAPVMLGQFKYGMRKLGMN